MQLVDDGDIVRGLGYVTLYAAYIEEAIDECMKVVASYDSVPPEKVQRFKISQRIEYVLNRLSITDHLPAELCHFPNLLAEIKVLLEHRNEVIHGRIYGVVQGGNDELRPGRSSGTVRDINSGELYDLANAMLSVLAPLNHASWFSIPRLLR